MRSLARSPACLRPYIPLLTWKYTTSLVTYWSRSNWIIVSSGICLRVTRRYSGRGMGVPR